MIVGTNKYIKNSPSYVICDEIIEFNLKSDEFGVYHTGNEIGRKKCLL